MTDRRGLCIRTHDHVLLTTGPGLTTVRMYQYGMLCICVFKSNSSGRVDVYAWPDIGVQCTRQVRLEPRQVRLEFLYWS
jgi:hypothetical protein